MEGMSNACEYAGIREPLLNTSDDHAQVAVWGVHGTNYIIAQWTYSTTLGRANILTNAINLGCSTTY